MFNGKIFMSFMSASEMNISMNEYHNTPVEYYFNRNRGKLFSLKEKREAWMYPPKTIVIPYGEKVKSSIGKLFTMENQVVVSKYIWLVFDDDDTYKLSRNSEENYIPYNCQFLIVKNLMKERDYGIEEIYHPSRKTYELFVRHFGNWNDAKGITIPEPDIYKRRLDMNGTILVATYQKTYKRTFDLVEEIADTISRVMNIRRKMKHFHENEGENYEIWELNLTIKGISAPTFLPFFIGPFYKHTINFYLAYDKKYEHHGVSPLLKPFSVNLWMSVLGWLIMSAISITIILKPINKRLESKLSSQILLSDCLYEPFDSILNQDGGKIAAQSSLKMVSIASRIVALILLPLYTGAIASFIVIPVIKLPFTTPNEFVRDGSYRAGFANFSKLDQYFKLSNDPWLQKMSPDFLIPLAGLYEDALDEGLKNICDDYRFALLLSGGVNLENRINCKVIKIHLPVTFSWSVILSNVECPYQAIFNRIVYYFRSIGNTEKMIGGLSEEVAGDFTIIEPKKNDENIEVQLINLAPIFTLVGVLYAFSAIVLFAETAHFNKMKQKEKKNSISRLKLFSRYVSKIREKVTAKIFLFFKNSNTLFTKGITFYKAKRGKVTVE